MFAIAVSRSVVQGVCSSSLNISCRVFAAVVLKTVMQGVCSSKDILLQGVRLIQQESWYGIGFIFCRFLLICQLEGLDHTFTLKWFFLLKYFRTVSEHSLGTGVPGVSKNRPANMFSRFFWFVGCWFFWEYLGYIFFWLCSAKDVSPCKYCWKAFSILFRKKI